jgi:hypothetical protein
MPSADSSASMRRATVECWTCSARAAADKLPPRITARK